LSLCCEHLSEHATDDALARFTAMEHQGWKGARGSSLEADPAMCGFFAELAKDMARRGELRAFTLSVDDTPVAMQWIARRHQRYWVLKIAYDEAWRRCAPGILLTLRVIEHACGESDVDAYEFLGADERWIHPWATDQRHYANALLCPRSVWGVLAWSVHTARSTLKAWTANRTAASIGRCDGPASPDQRTESADRLAD